MARLPLVQVPIVDYGADEAAMVRYRREGEERAMALGNRGPVRYDGDGRVHPDILAAYERCGFYVFEGVLGQEELDDIERDSLLPPTAKIMILRRLEEIPRRGSSRRRWHPRWRVCRRGRASYRAASACPPACRRSG